MERRSTRVHCQIAATPAEVYHALTDADAIRQWRFPEGMTCRVHVFEAREGGALRISLTYEEISGKGKTTAHMDTYHGRFVRLIPDKVVVEVDEFETDDPAMKGEMMITTTLTLKGDGTELVAVHDGLPPGVSLEDNQIGWEMALARLKKLVEGQGQEKIPEEG